MPAPESASDKLTKAGELTYENRSTFQMPRYCGACGVYLMGGATVHKKPCPLMDGLMNPEASDARA